jgi:hypothetical protein
MPTIENYAEHPFQFPKPTKATDAGGVLGSTTSMFEEAITFPKAGNKDDSGIPVPSRKNITDDQLKQIKSHHVAKGWFGRGGLAVSAEERPDYDPWADDNRGDADERTDVGPGSRKMAKQ